tara:strand:+ start:519 stop:812 length:294 start_codon:yes stop_codon:yes gene_type:complete
MTKVMVITALIISYILYWATSSVCNFNKVLERKSDRENVIAEEINPTLGHTKIYYFSELSCKKTDVEFTLERLAENLETISVLVYQELTTDIRGNPN